MKTGQSAAAVQFSDHSRSRSRSPAGGACVLPPRPGKARLRLARRNFHRVVADRAWLVRRSRATRGEWSRGPAQQSAGAQSRHTDRRPLRAIGCPRRPSWSTHRRLRVETTPASPMTNRPRANLLPPIAARGARLRVIRCSAKTCSAVPSSLRGDRLLPSGGALRAKPPRPPRAESRRGRVAARRSCALSTRTTGPKSPKPAANFRPGSHDSVFAADAPGDRIQVASTGNPPKGPPSSTTRVSLTMNTPSAVSTGLGCLLLCSGALAVVPGCADSEPFPDSEGPGVTEGPAPVAIPGLGHVVGEYVLQVRPSQRTAKLVRLKPGASARPGFNPQSVDAISVIQDGISGSGPANSVELDTDQNSIKSGTSCPGGVAASFCGTVTLRSFYSPPQQRVCAGHVDGGLGHQVSLHAHPLSRARGLSSPSALPLPGSRYPASRWSARRALPSTSAALLSRKRAMFTTPTIR